MSTPFYHARLALAQRFCDALLGTDVIDATSGLFLSGRRRTGKSSFLRRDLMPEMERRGWLPIYVDLWEQRPREPGELIEQVLSETLAALKTTGLGRKARGLGLERVGVPGLVSVDLDRSGNGRPTTIARLIEAIVEKSRKPVALLIDEAQYALDSEEGLQVMFALKAARDRLNQSGEGQKLHLVLTGSSRDKLSHLLLRKDEPFYGASIVMMPTLARDFVEGYTTWINERLASGRRFSVDAMERAFEIVGRRPELLRRVAGQTVANEGDPRALDSILDEDVARFQRMAWQEFESDHAQLTPAQRAVLDAMVRLLPDYEPFSESAQAAYRAAYGQPLPTSTVQSALDALREKGIIWRAGRGDYALEDEDLRGWYLKTWPQPRPLLPADEMAFGRSARARRVIDEEPEASAKASRDVGKDTGNPGKVAGRKLAGSTAAKSKAAGSKAAGSKPAGSKPAGSKAGSKPAPRRRLGPPPAPGAHLPGADPDCPPEPAENSGPQAGGSSNQRS